MSLAGLAGTPDFPEATVEAEVAKAWRERPKAGTKSRGGQHRRGKLLVKGLYAHGLLLMPFFTSAAAEVTAKASDVSPSLAAAAVAFDPGAHQRSAAAQRHVGSRARARLVRERQLARNALSAGSPLGDFAEANSHGSGQGGIALEEKRTAEGAANTSEASEAMEDGGQRQWAAGKGQKSGDGAAVLGRATEAMEIARASELEKGREVAEAARPNTAQAEVQEGNASSTKVPAKIRTLVRHCPRGAPTCLFATGMCSDFAAGEYQCEGEKNGKPYYRKLELSDKNGVGIWDTQLYLFFTHPDGWIVTREKYFTDNEYSGYITPAEFSDVANPLKVEEWVWPATDLRCIYFRQCSS